LFKFAHFIYLTFLGHFHAELLQFSRVSNCFDAVAHGSEQEKESMKRHISNLQVVPSHPQHLLLFFLPFYSGLALGKTFALGVFGQSKHT